MCACCACVYTYVSIWVYFYICVVPFLFWEAMNRVKELTDLSVLQLSGVVG